MKISANPICRSNIIEKNHCYTEVNLVNLKIEVT